MDCYSKLKSHRFDPPGGWRWPCRFSLEELNTTYHKLFGYNWFELNADRAIKTIEVFHVGKDRVYGAVRLEDGGYQHLESCTIEELDWFLFIGQSFLAREETWMPNPLFGKLGREDALITIDLLQQL